MAGNFDPSQLVANMEAILQRIAGKGGVRAVVAGAKVIGAAMASHTPELIEKKHGSNSLEPGAVKRGIKVRTRNKEGQGPVAFVGPTGKGGAVNKVAYDVEYGHRIVTGGKNKPDFAGKFVGSGKVHAEDVPPHPFLRPAFEQSESAALDAVGAQLAKEFRGE